METIPCSIPVNVGFRVPSKVSRANIPETTIVKVGDIEFGGSGIVVIAGPCAVESKEQLFETARSVNKSGARILRGGAFKPRSSP
jgi:3-deoxy-7-phosphoheptulonate synthase